MVQQRQGIQSALAMGDYPPGIAGPAMAASIGLDEAVFSHELIAPRIGPVFQAAATTVQEEKWLAGALNFEVQVDSIDWHRVSRPFIWHESLLFCLPKMEKGRLPFLGVAL